MISSCNIFSIWRVTLINLNFGGLITCVCLGTLFELLELSYSQLNLIQLFLRVLSCCSYLSLRGALDLRAFRATDPRHSLVYVLTRIFAFLLLGHMLARVCTHSAKVRAASLRAPTMGLVS